MKKERVFLIIVAITWIGILEAIALSMGINGTVFSLSLAAIAGLAGFKLRLPKLK